MTRRVLVVTVTVLLYLHLSALWVTPTPAWSCPRRATDLDGGSLPLTGRARVP